MIKATALPYPALVLNALVWGLSWWPLRELHNAGLHPLWSSVITYLLGLVVVVLVMPRVVGEFIAHKALWVLALAGGFTMVGFNWGVAIGEVIRVVLLFYLMPVWAVLLARVVLKEILTARAFLLVGLAVMGAVLVLSPNGALSFPLPSNLGEWLGLMGGMAFAANNIMLRHQAKRTAHSRLFAMFVGGVTVPLLVAVFSTLVLGFTNKLVPWPIWPDFYGLLLLTVFAAGLLLANCGLQYGASRLPASVTAVVMLSEVIFATLSAILLTDEILTTQVAVGGVMILAAAGLSALKNNAVQ